MIRSRPAYVARKEVRCENIRRVRRKGALCLRGGRTNKLTRLKGDKKGRKLKEIR